MIVPNLPFLLLNSSAVLNLTARPTSLNGEGNSVCFTQPPYPVPPLLPAKWHDCYEAINLAKQDDKKDAPIYFSRDAKVGYGLPHAWDLGSCEIMIDVDPHDEGDTLTMVDIVRAAFTVAVLCVKDYPFLGGRERVGPKKVIIVFVSGQEAPPEHPRLRIGQTVKREDGESGRNTLARLEGGHS